MQRLESNLPPQRLDKRVTWFNFFGRFGNNPGLRFPRRYTNQHDLKFQDALGNALLQHARVVPGGILVSD